MNQLKIVVGSIGITASAVATLAVATGCSPRSPQRSTSNAPAVCSFTQPAPPGLSVDASALVFATTWSAVGPEDDHCAATEDASAQVQATTPEACCPDDAAIAAAENDDSGAPYGVTMWNSSGSDDDCKYNVQWQSTSINENKNVWFKINIQSRVSDAGVSGAWPRIEVVDPETSYDEETPGQTVIETAPGEYIAGPVTFNSTSAFADGGGGMNGLYVRFHVFEWCLDVLPESPHGHSAWYLTVLH